MVGYFCFVADVAIMSTYAREGTVVPEVALVGEAVTDEAQLALLGVLLDGVEELVLGDLEMVGSKNQHRIGDRRGEFNWDRSA